jgi:hypothetical protein
MKKFIGKIALYVISFTLFFSILAALGFYLVRQKIIEKLPHNRTIILGDSNTQRGVNDALLPSCINYSATAENYRLTYFKLKFIQKHNPKLKEVYLSFSPHNLYFGFPTNHRHSKNALLVLEQNDYQSYYKGRISPKRYFYTLKYGLGHFVDNLLGKNVKIGEFEELHPKDRQFEFWQMGYCENLKNQVITDFDRDQLYYLEKIIAFCKASNLDLNLLVLPKHPVLWEDSSYRKNDLFKLHQSKYSQLPLLDFSELILKDEDFQDPIHLNKLGAAKLTKAFKNRLAGLD